MKSRWNKTLIYTKTEGSCDPVEPLWSNFRQSSMHVPSHWSPASLPSTIIILDPFSLLQVRRSWGQSVVIAQVMVFQAMPQDHCLNQTGGLFLTYQRSNGKLYLSNKFASCLVVIGVSQTREKDLRKGRSSPCPRRFLAICLVVVKGYNILSLAGMMVDTPL
jgi:hypothetical protein